MLKMRDLVRGLCFGAIAAATAVAGTGPTIKIIPDWKTPGRTIPSDFSGLSFETRRMLPDAQGKHYFTPENKALIATFKTLGVKSLRIGGNTSDNPAIKIPSREDIDELFKFAKEADLHVIYTLRLRGVTDPQDDVKTAEYIWKNYRPLVTCFAVGNEPNVYAKEYPTYKAMIAKFYDAILEAAPGVEFCGPGTTPGRASWTHDFTVDMAKSGKIRYITQHSYPGGSAKKVKSPEIGRDEMLSPEFVASYFKFYDSFGPVVQENRLSYRLEETNSYFHGGAKDVSDTMASALWGLDYIYWWAWHGAEGLNFHTGDEVASADVSVPCRYAVYWTAPDGNNVHPLGYALKAFDVADPGELVALKIENQPAGSKGAAKNENKVRDINLTAYGVKNSDQTFFVTIINKEHGESGRDATVTILPGASYGAASVMFMTSPNHDAAATAGVTLGGAQINDDATWSGKWTDLSAASSGSKSTGAGAKWTLSVPKTSAAIVRFSSK